MPGNAAGVGAPALTAPGAAVGLEPPPTPTTAAEADDTAGPDTGADIEVATAPIGRVCAGDSACVARMAPMPDIDPMIDRRSPLYDPLP